LVRRPRGLRHADQRPPQGGAPIGPHVDLRSVSGSLLGRSDPGLRVEGDPRHEPESPARSWSEEEMRSGRPGDPRPEVVLRVRSHPCHHLIKAHTHGSTDSESRDSLCTLLWPSLIAGSLWLGQSCVMARNHRGNTWERCHLALPERPHLRTGSTKKGSTRRLATSPGPSAATPTNRESDNRRGSRSPAISVMSRTGRRP
jgi:hypothetical protein